MSSSAILLIDCPDRKGLVAGVANLLYRHGANIMHADQHQDHAAGLFFMRVEWALDGFPLEEFRAAFARLAEELSMRWRLELSARRPRAAVFVSHYLHSLARFYGIEFRHTPVTAETRAEAEREQLALLRAAGVELVVLARYMQILTPGFVAEYPGRIINVHHSFLPAFVGAKPYHAAYARGVKLIGATSHYVTDALDDGPIIEQDVARVSHRDQVEDLIAKGRDLERVVLSRAVRWHLEHRILSYGNKTVIFD